MALTPEQKAAAHQRGLQAESEREAREARQKPAGATISSDYDRFRSIGLSHEEALVEIEKRKKAEEQYEKERGDNGFQGPVASIRAQEAAAIESTATGESHTTCLRSLPENQVNVALSPTAA